MAQAYAYRYNGEQRTKQDKCKTDMPLDKPRIWLDFNELCGTDNDGAPVYLFSQADIVNDSYGRDVELYDGMKVSVFDDDSDGSGNPDALLADGIITRNYLEQYPQIKWAIKLIKHGLKNGDEYVYRMSDLK